MESVKVVIAGDLFPTASNCDLFTEGKTEELFDEKIRNIFAGADLALCNLEGVLYTGDAPKKKDGVRMQAPPEALKVYRDLNISMVSLANNHATDYGEKGVKSTAEALAAYGIQSVGSGKAGKVRKSRTFELKDRKVTFYAVAETLFNAPSGKGHGANVYDEPRVLKDLERLKEKCDCLVVIYHGGWENFSYATPYLRRRFHLMADAGADVILAQHTHAVCPEEYYNGSYLLYGQGNFLFNYTSRPSRTNYEGLLLELVLNPEGFRVIRHRVLRKDPGVIYDPEQDLAAFEKRSRDLAEGADTASETARFENAKLDEYLYILRGNNEADRKAKRADPKGFASYIKKQYTLRQLEEIGELMTNEEERALVITGLRRILRERERAAAADTGEAVLTAEEGAAEVEAAAAENTAEGAEVTAEEKTLGE